MATCKEAHRLAELAGAIRRSSLTRLEMAPVGCENWRPYPGAMSIADLAQHLIDADEWLFAKFDNPLLPRMVGAVGSANVETRGEFEALLKRLGFIGDRRVEFIAGQSEAALASTLADERFGGEVSRWWVIVRGNFDHESHHRGQLATYLRLLESM